MKSPKIGNLIELPHAIREDRLTLLRACKPKYLLMVDRKQAPLAIVTGSNQGIGYEIVKIFLKQNLRTVLTYRNVDHGTEALNALKGQEDFDQSNLFHHQLDITDQKSIQMFRDWVIESFGPQSVSILVNNAGIAFKSRDPTPFAQQTAPTLGTNTYSTMNFTDLMIPLLTPLGARIVFVASQSGLSALNRMSKALQTRWQSPSLSRQDIYFMLNEFQTAVLQGNHQTLGWPDSNYGVSKLAVITLAKALACVLPESQPNTRVYSCCPGYCATNMSSFQGQLHTSIVEFSFFVCLSLSLCSIIYIYIY